MVFIKWLSVLQKPQSPAVVCATGPPSWLNNPVFGVCNVMSWIGTSVLSTTRYCTTCFFLVTAALLARVFVDRIKPLSDFLSQVANTPLNAFMAAVVIRQMRRPTPQLT